jgi:hypothetical protein
LKQGIKYLKELSWNKSLVKGPDFGGTEKGKYLPAIEVYQGGFYGAVGSDGIQSLRTSPHHFLIISGLYGLLLPNEQIQIYESPMEDLVEIQEVWKEDNALTKILLNFLLIHNINLIINLSSQLAYIHLFDWLKLSTDYMRITKKPLKYLYATHEIMKGPEALKKFGDLLKSKLIGMDSQALVSLNDGDIVSSVRFSSRPDYEKEFEILSLIQGEAWEELYGLYRVENTYLEFKPALSIPKKDPSRSIEAEYFEAICAFLNTNGGALFIGVDNQGNIKGIDRDYPFLSNYSNSPYPLSPNQDGYEQLFDELFSKYIGKEHLKKIKLRFWKKMGKTVAIVGVEGKSPKPVYFRDPKLRNERFFIRGTGTTRELDGRKRREYLNENFLGKPVFRQPGCLENG